MTYSLDTIPTNALLVVVVSGGPTVADHATLWPELFDLAARGNSCVLAMAHTSEPIDADAARRIGAAVGSGEIPGECRIAWVESSPECEDGMREVESALIDQGIHAVQFFDSAERALSWLPVDSSRRLDALNRLTLENISDAVFLTRDGGEQIPEDAF